MELFSQAFIQAVRQMLSTPGIVILGTIPIPRGKPLPLVEEIRHRCDVKVYNVSKPALEAASQPVGLPEHPCGFGDPESGPPGRTGSRRGSELALSLRSPRKTGTASCQKSWPSCRGADPEAAAAPVCHPVSDSPSARGCEPSTLSCVLRASVCCPMQLGM